MSDTQATILCQKTLPWGNMTLGTSNLRIWAAGCFITELAEILETTPDVVNEKLNGVQGFAEDSNKQLDEVIWAKVSEAFPGVSANYVSPYDNAAVEEALAGGKSVIVEVDAGPIGNPGGLHAVRYVGGEKLHDPWTGTERPTSDFPTVYSFVVVDTSGEAAADETAAPVGQGTPPAEPDAASNTPVAGENTANLPAGWPATYQGLDMTNLDSIKTAIDTWKKDASGGFVDKAVHEDYVNKVTGALGINPATPVDSVAANITTLKQGFAKQVQDQTATLPTDTAQVEGTAPAVGASPNQPVANTTTAEVTMETLPDSIKQTVLNHVAAFEAGLKDVMGLNK